MNAPIAITTGYYQPSAFDPLDLQLLWMVHTDDSTVTAGKISAIDDRVAAYSFVQATASNRPLANTTEYSGHTVWELDNTTGVRRFLVNNTAALSATLNGFPACTFGAWIKTSDPGAQNDISGHTNNTSTYTNAVRLGYTTNGYRVTSQSAVGSSLYSLVGIPSAWSLYCMVYDGAGSVEFFTDGVSDGVDTATHRSPAGMQFVTLCEAVNNVSATKNILIGGLFAATGQMSTGQQSQFSTWFASTFV